MLGRKTSREKAVNSINLIPYCPWPINHGGKVEMWKHLDELHSLGECTIASAASRPVGMGWTHKAKQAIEERGFSNWLREELLPQRNWKQILGLVYGTACKGFRLERAFGHANPYHRPASPQDFLLYSSREADLVLINNSYCAKPLCQQVLPSPSTQINRPLFLQGGPAADHRKTLLRSVRR